MEGSEESCSSGHGPREAGPARVHSLLYPCSLSFPLSPPPPPHTHTHSHNPSLSLSHSHTHTHNPTLSLTHTLSLCQYLTAEDNQCGGQLYRGVVGVWMQWAGPTPRVGVAVRVVHSQTAESHVRHELPRLQSWRADHSYWWGRREGQSVSQFVSAIACTHMHAHTWQTFTHRNACTHTHTQREREREMHAHTHTHKRERNACTHTHTLTRSLGEAVEHGDRVLFRHVLRTHCTSIYCSVQFN